MAFVKVKKWSYWKPKTAGEQLEGVFTGFHAMRVRATGEEFDSFGVRSADGSLVGCTHNRAVKQIRLAGVTVGTKIRLTYLGFLPWKETHEANNGTPLPAEQKHMHQFELEIDDGKS